MPESQWAELIKTLGVAGPLVALLFWLLRENMAERKAMTTEFLSTLKDTVLSASEAAVRSAEAMENLSMTIKDASEKHSNEHRRILDALIAAGRPEQRIGGPRGTSDEQH